MLGVWVLKVGDSDDIVHVEFVEVFNGVCFLFIGE